jgi:asparagine synthase (glutamine-hydrolysing)
MCGIVGAVNWGNREVLGRMNSVQAHRGPDDAGLWDQRLSDGTWVGLGNRRLAIIDLSPAGHMPMSNDDGTLWITYNGEVYNFLELRRELEAKGHTFHSGTDTEVILHLYEESGPDSVKRLNGMFALAIWDSREEQLFLARDHFGIKPLYYIQKGERFAFASEIKSLLELPDQASQVNLEALHQYLTFAWVPDPLTIFQDVYKLPAGTFALLKRGRFTTHGYWDMSFPPADARFPLTEAELIEEGRERFVRSVKAQMVSDVPLGAFLSAGLDSSGIVAAMAQASSSPVRTYTITFPAKYRVGETTIDDPAVASRTASHFGCKHTEIVVEPDVVELLPKLLWHMDELVTDPALIAAYLINREARKTVTVLLSGIGGDEIFAGYRKHVAHYLAKRYRKIPRILREDVVEPLIQSLPVMRNTPLMGSVRLAKKMARSASLAPEQRFLMDSTYVTEPLKGDLYTPAVREATNGCDPWARHLGYFKNVRDADFLNQMLYLDTKTFMVSLNLTYNDKMSMASSVEARVPFLDWEFASWAAWNVPPHLKLKGRTTKHLLRKILEGWLPSEVLRQKKAGFGAPVGYWLAYDLREMTDDLLSEATLRRRGYFEPATIRRMIADQRSGREDWSIQIWQLLIFELWQQAFVDKKHEATVAIS